MAGIFQNLEDPKFFCDYVKEHFENAPKAAIENFPCVNEIAPKRLEYSFGEYKQNIKAYSVLLHSENPDQYKRSGALLHALYKSGIVSSVTFSGDMEAVEAGTVLNVNYAEAQEKIQFPKFYHDYHNQILSFDLAYKCCAAYETVNPPGYDFGYLYNVAHYLWKNTDLTMDSLSMLFRSLMHRPT